ncbi:endodeoxyribonuclease RusA [Cupriavidus sp. SK-4]|uniref:endodeoxyribonuclease RusA n=1 Tax=Cupriavidus sp. SK-4 TaxID=574750 RepID=UPI0004535BA4|nr:endodeoxyribonuclease RusA [Cupriavidus sp. SK-4]EYS89478.1 endodeoxyribonuclease RusA [Cupriavidus sp. SK-4]
MTTRIAFTIMGEAASKANSRKIVTIHGRPASIKSDKARKFAMDALRQIPPAARQMLEGPVRVTMHLFYATERPDLDESVLLDVLQAQYSGKGGRRALVHRGVYVNDRQVREKHIYHGIDRANPRAEIIVEPLHAQQTGLFVGDAA